MKKAALALALALCAHYAYSNMPINGHTVIQLGGFATVDGLRSALILKD